MWNYAAILLNRLHLEYRHCQVLHVFLMDTALMVTSVDSTSSTTQGPLLQFWTMAQTGTTHRRQSHVFTLSWLAALVLITNALEVNEKSSNFMI